MDELARLLLLLALTGLALTVVGTVGARLSTEERRIRRSLRKVLGGEPEAMLVAQGRGRGAGFSFTGDLMAVTWDLGAWCLIYRLDELLGAELVVDGEVIARAYRGEPRRALDLLTGADRLVRLRLLFDDARRPDFDLDLWLPEDEGRKGMMTAAEAVQEANRWIARTEAVVRKPLPPGRRPMVAPAGADAQPVAIDDTAPPPRAADAGEAALPLFEPRDPPPWEDDPAPGKVDGVKS
jgi:hypothetical protein